MSTTHTFTEAEIKLLRDVTLSHTELSKRLGVGSQIIQTYRRSVLKIHLRGLNYDFEELRSKLDWTRPTMEIAVDLKVSPETVDQWKRKVEKKAGLGKLSPADIRKILQSPKTSIELGLEFGVHDSTIRALRIKHGKKSGAGRRTIKVEDFPTDTDWKLPVNQLKTKLGVSWVVADRLRTEALNAAGYRPRVHLQLPLPGLAGEQVLPSALADVDWTENASMIAAHLKLDRAEVLRLKSLAQYQQRREKSA